MINGALISLMRGAEFTRSLPFKLHLEGAARNIGVGQYSLWPPNDQG